MAVAIICAVAFAASLLTFFTGFGLGTILLPAFAAFFPPEVAVALTAIVHLLNNLFKLLLVGRHANLQVTIRFGAPAVVSAFAGAFVLGWLAELQPLLRYDLAGRSFRIMPVALVIAILMLVFAALDLWPGFKRLSLGPKYLPLGGVVTGFVGGLSGHQGALRSAFLIRAGLNKHEFIATGVVIAVLVDVSRLIVYSERFFVTDFTANAYLLGAATLAAFGGALAGNRLVKKVNLRSLEVGVAFLLILIALGLGSGLI